VTPWLFPLVSAVFISTVIYLLFDYFGAGGGYENRRIRARLEGLLTDKKSAKIERTTNFSNIFSVNLLLKRQPLTRNLFALLQLTGWTMPISVFILADLMLGCVIGAIVKLVFKHVYFAAPAGFVAMLVPYWLLIVNKQRYINKFTILFPDALMLMKNAIRAGQGIQAAFQMVAKESPYPISKEFSQLVHEIELGSHLTEALGELYKRIGTIDLRIFVLGVFIQHEVGGNLVELFSRIEHTIRERLTMAREINVLSAQGKMTGIVLMLLPIGLAGFLLMMNPKYFEPMFEEELGKTILGFSIFLQVIGGFVVRSITSFRVT